MATMAMTMTASDNSVYTMKGFVSEVMPIPPIAENCIDVPAGPIRFVLESRLLTQGLIADQGAEYAALAHDLEEDGGASLHVFGSDDGLEHLRFDCFEKQPHYHYVRNREQRNQVLGIDEVAVDPIRWTIACVRDRLPEMLDYAGADDLAAKVRARPADVAAGVERVEAMIGRLGG